MGIITTQLDALYAEKTQWERVMKVKGQLQLAHL